MEQKKKPYRNKKFMRFCHERMRGLCCLDCGRQWTELHHFGAGGGIGMKPSDLQVARLCKTCHDSHPWKMVALITRGKWEILSYFLRDALYLNEAWIQHLDAGQPVDIDQCSMEELNRWLAAHGSKSIGWRDWLVQWADKRAVELYDHLTECKDG